MIYIILPSIICFVQKCIICLVYFNKFAYIGGVCTKKEKLLTCISNTKTEMYLRYIQIQKYFAPSCLMAKLPISIHTNYCKVLLKLNLVSNNTVYNTNTVSNFHELCTSDNRVRHQSVGHFRHIQNKYLCRFDLVWILIKGIEILYVVIL